MANYLQELAQDAVCQSHTSHMTGLWFLPARPLRLNTNEWMNDVEHISYGKVSCIMTSQFNTVGAIKITSPFIISFLNYRFTCSILLFQFFPPLLFPSFQVSNFLFILVSFSWNDPLHAVHVITNGTLSVFLLIFLLTVFGHCRASRKGQRCLSFSLFFSFCVYGSTFAGIFIQSRATWSNLCHVSIRCLLMFCWPCISV